MKILEDLEAWKMGRRLRIDISRLIKKFPDYEKYDLTQQIRRSSRSIPANIAEGYGRYHYLENIQFCRIARGSLLETLEHLYVALDENYIDQEEFRKFSDQCVELRKVINGYIRFLMKMKYQD